MSLVPASSENDATHRAGAATGVVVQSPAPASHLAAFAASVAALLLVVVLSACGGAGASDNEPTQPAGQAGVEVAGDAAGELTFVTNSESTEITLDQQVALKIAATHLDRLGGCTRP